jgi:hypothetical protein
VKFVAVVLVLVAAFWAWQRHQRIENEQALAAVASQLAGRDVGVACQGLVAELVDIRSRAGDVRFPAGRPPDHMFLTRKICKALERFRRASSHPELDCLLSVDWSRWRVETDFHSACAERARPAAEAINTLAHESMHLRGFLDEAQTECYAVQEDAWTVMRLGGTPEQGAAVARFMLAMQPALPSEYQSSDCRAGGRLDLHPETASFPSEPVPALPPAALRGPALGSPG